MNYLKDEAAARTAAPESSSGKATNQNGSSLAAVVALLRDTGRALTTRELPPTEAEIRQDENETARRSRRFWGALVLTNKVSVFDSIVAGRPVMAGLLDAEMLRRALRGGRLPAPDTYMTITDAMLEAVEEAGPVS